MKITVKKMKSISFSRVTPGNSSTELFIFPDMGSRFITISYRYIPPGEVRPRREFTVAIEDMDVLDAMLTDKSVLTDNKVIMKDRTFRISENEETEYPGEIRVIWDGTARIVQGVPYKLYPDDRPPRWKFRLSPLETARVVRLIRRFQLVCDVITGLEVVHGTKSKSS